VHCGDCLSSPQEKAMTTRGVAMLTQAQWDHREAESMHINLFELYLPNQCGLVSETSWNLLQKNQYSSNCFAGTVYMNTPNDHSPLSHMT
jgi:hypothetical protein